MQRNLFLWIVIFGAIGVLSSNGDVVINEIMYHARSNDLDAEYLELYNSSSQVIDLSGWTLQDGISYSFPQGTTIAANGYLLVCRNEIFIRTLYNLSGSVNTVGNYAPSRLSNSGEEIRLYDNQGVEIDRVEYSDSSPWPKEADGNGSSLELVHPLVDNNNVLYWKASVRPTPGLANSTLVSTAPPRFRQVRRLPSSPTSSDAVRLEAVFAPDDQLSAVTLNYTVNSTSSKTISMTGQGNVYSAEIPALADGSIVEYTVSALNIQNFSIVAPFGQNAGRFLYQVKNNPAAAGSIVIHEIMYNNPSQDGVDREWIELFNPSSQAMDISLWSIKDSNDLHVFRIPRGTSIAANGFLVVAVEKDPGWQFPVLTGLPFSLNNKGDAVRVFDPNDRPIASVVYNDNGEWPLGADGEGGSLELLQVNRPNGEANNWAVSGAGGTPGKPNARAITDPNYRDYDIVINEIFYHPEDEEYDGNLQKEFIELYNRSDKAIDLGGWYFSNGVEFAFPQGTVMPGNGYLLVCRDTSLYPDVANKTGNFILRLNNAGEALALTNDLGVVVDFVRYNDKFPWPVRPDGDGRSLELIVPSGDNRLPSNWRSGQPFSPGKPNSTILPNEPPRISGIVHTPRYPSASTSDQQTDEKSIIKVGETWRYFEGTQAPPSHWTSPDFDDSSWKQGPSGFGFGDNDDNTELNMINRYISVYVRKTFTLDSIEGFATLVLGMDYDDGFVAYLNGVEVARSNMSGNPPAFDRAADGNHEAGAMESFDISNFIKNLRKGVNVLAVQGHNVSLGSSDFSLIPALSTIRVLEAGEDESDSLLITARVEDADGLSEVKLHYQRCSSPFGTGLVLGEWKSVTMVDNGTGGDKAAGDGIFSFQLNSAETLRPREVWRYKISAKNKAGQETIMPLPGEKTETRAFFVEDRLDMPSYPTIYLFAERSVLDWLNRNVDSDKEQPSLVVIDGDVYDLTNSGGIRYRGHVLRDKPKKSWKIQFPKDNRWKGRRSYNLNANYQTSPLLRGECGFLEHLAYQFMHQAGLPAADTQHYRIMMNNSYYGLFIGIEQYNQDFLNDHEMPAETLIFKAGVKARRSYMTPEANFQAYADKYENSIGREDDIAALIAYIEQLNSAEDLKAFFEANLDIETYLDYLVSVAFLSHVDSTEKNYFPTRGVDGRWFVMPWDMSHSWGEIHTNDRFPLISTYNLLDGAEGGVFGTNMERRKFLTVPEFRARYYERLRYFADHIFTREHLDPFFDSYWNYLEPALREDMQRWNSPGQIDQMISEMKKYVTARRDFVLTNTNVRPADLPPVPVNGSPADGEVLSVRSILLMVQLPISSTPPMAEWELQEGSADFFQPHWSRKDSLHFISIQVPATVIASGKTYYWRFRYQALNGVWSDWSTPTSFKTSNNLPLPEVQNPVATAFDRSVRIEWDLPAASDLIRVDIYQDNSIVESTPIGDNRVRIRDLENGKTYYFTIKTVSADRRTSTGVTVEARPMGPVIEGSIIAYYRFEGNARDSVGLFPDGRLLGKAAFSAPPAANPVPLTEQANTASLQLDGVNGNGFQFGSSESYLDWETSVTLECYALFLLNSIEPAVLLDRYDETNAGVDGVWRFGVGLSSPGSLDFFLNDGDTSSGYNGRLHIASAGGVVAFDGLFHHYAAVVNLAETSMAQKVKLYIDGRLVSSTVVHDDGISTYRRFRTESDIPVLAGARRIPTGTMDVIPGRIDEVRITAGTLSPKQFLTGPDGTAIRDWSLY